MSNKGRVVEQLTAMRKEVVDRQAKLARHVERRDEPLSADSGEQALELENQETMVKLSQLMAEELAAIEKALVRVQAGVYERCAICSELIDAKRMEALPTTHLCIRCSQEIC